MITNKMLNVEKEMVWQMKNELADGNEARAEENKTIGFRNQERRWEMKGGDWK